MASSGANDHALTLPMVEKLTVLISGRHENFYQLVWIMILAIFLYISYVYNEIFTCPNGIFTRLERVDIDFFLPLLTMWDKQNLAIHRSKFQLAISMPPNLQKCKYRFTFAKISACKRFPLFPITTEARDMLHVVMTVLTGTQLIP